MRLVECWIEIIEEFEDLTRASEVDVDDLSYVTSLLHHVSIA